MLLTDRVAVRGGRDVARVGRGVTPVGRDVTPVGRVAVTYVPDPRRASSQPSAVSWS
ncbi:hypothetical protein [Nocardioides sp. NPDC000441]|uniref:hypothetical protein n=1 Tax=Nocardioides sp. NPDC000441 TaxID=3154256 RepID=UPI00332408C7